MFVMTRNERTAGFAKSTPENRLPVEFHFTSTLKLPLDACLANKQTILQVNEWVGGHHLDSAHARTIACKAESHVSLLSPVAAPAVLHK